MTTRWFVVSLALLGACDSNDKKGGAAAPDPEVQAIAAKPREAVSIPGLGLTIDVPAGTVVAPPYRPEDANRTAHLEQGPFMVNVFAVDQYSAPSFAKAKEVARADKLLQWISADETPTGWITFKEVVSDVQKGRRFEVDVRTKVGDRRWDCAISAKTRALAELALEACKSLR